MPPVDMMDLTQSVPPAMSEPSVAETAKSITVPAPPNVDPEMVVEEVPPFPVRPMTVEQYEYLVDIGFYGDARVEMLDGFVVNKLSHGDLAASIIDILTEILRTALTKAISVRCQLPVRLDSGAPEPDFTLAMGPGARYRDAKPIPSEIFLVIEVSDSTLRHNQRIKLRTYARNGIREYWIINCVDRQIEIYTAPTIAEGKPWYAVKTVLHHEEQATLRIDGEIPIEIPLTTLFGK